MLNDASVAQKRITPAGKRIYFDPAPILDIIKKWRLLSPARCKCSQGGCSANRLLAADRKSGSKSTLDNPGGLYCAVRQLNREEGQIEPEGYLVTEAYETEYLQTIGDNEIEYLKPIGGKVYLWFLWRQ